jgi:hypothetical protein
MEDYAMENSSTEHATILEFRLTRQSAHRVSQRSKYACAGSRVSKRRPRNGVYCYPLTIVVENYAFGIASLDGCG